MLRMMKDILGWAGVCSTMCSQMLSMNDLGEGKLLRILVQRKGESSGVLRLSVPLLSKLSNVGVEGDSSREKFWSRSQA